MTALLFAEQLRHNILSHFFYGLSHGYSVGKPKNNGLLRKKNTKGLILKQKGKRMAGDGEERNGWEIHDFEKFSQWF